MAAPLRIVPVHLRRPAEFNARLLSPRARKFAHFLQHDFGIDGDLLSPAVGGHRCPRAQCRWHQGAPGSEVVLPAGRQQAAKGQARQIGGKESVVTSSAIPAQQVQQDRG